MLLTSPPRHKYVDTLPCNLSLIACFLALMCHKVVARYGWACNNHFTANLIEKLPINLNKI